MRTGYTILFSAVLFLLTAFAFFLADVISKQLNLEEISNFVRTFSVPASTALSALLLIVLVYYQIYLATGKYVMDGIRRTVLDKEKSMVLIEDERKGEVKPKKTIFYFYYQECENQYKSACHYGTISPRVY